MTFRIFLFFLFTSTFCWGQPDSTVADLDLRIMPPTIDRALSHAIQPKLERKVIDIFTRNGVANREGSTFMVYPMLNLIDYGKLEGISTEETVQLELNLLVRNIFSKVDITVFTRMINGSGRTKEVAVKKAINSIRPHHKSYVDFVTGMQEKIESYYEANCESIMRDVQRAMTQEDYQQVITMVFMLPKNSDCRNANQSTLDMAYEQYQRQNCQSLVQQAEVAILKKDYKDAINVLGQVDVNSPCKNDAKELLQSLSQKVDEQTTRKMDFLKKVYGDNVEIEKARQQSMKSISNTYIEGIKKE